MSANGPLEKYWILNVKICIIKKNFISNLWLKLLFLV
jgi:hypothetical protein